MTLFGLSTKWISSFKDMQAIVIEAISRSWPACSASCSTSSLEDEITRKLVLILRKDKTLRALPIFIESQLELLANELKGDVVAKGYLDIAILFFTPSRKVYLALECKRLNVLKSRGRIKTLAAEYVLKGMMRFVRAQYAKSFPVGAMIGYVMNGDIALARSAVLKQIQRHKHKLHCGRDDVMNGNPPAELLTVHRRKCGAIRLTHILVPHRGDTKK